MRDWLSLLRQQGLVIASHNAGKVREIGDLLAPLNIQVSSASEHDVPEPEETENSFRGNARLKADHVAAHTKLPALADDSGLVVPVLDGDPGIYSARWAGPSKDFAIAMQRVQDELSAANQKTTGQAAYFACALALAAPGETTLDVEGVVHGTLSFPPRGKKGFGYDPIFCQQGSPYSFAEIDPAEKHRISHRADAFNKLMRHLQSSAAT